MPCSFGLLLVDALDPQVVAAISSGSWATSADGGQHRHLGLAASTLPSGIRPLWGGSPRLGAGVLWPLGRAARDRDRGLDEVRVDGAVQRLGSWLASNSPDNQEK